MDFGERFILAAVLGRGIFCFGSVSIIHFEGGRRPHESIGLVVDDDLSRGHVYKK